MAGRARDDEGPSAGVWKSRDGEHWKLPWGSQHCLWGVERLLLVLPPDERVKVIHELIVRFHLNTVRFIKPEEGGGVKPTT